MPQPAVTLEGTMRFLRIVHSFLFVSMLIYIWTGEFLIPHEPHDVQSLWFTLLALSPAIVSVALFFRMRKLQPAMDTLQMKPDDQIALLGLRTTSIISFVLSESILLFGFALRFMGGTTSQSLPFYLVGVGLMLLWWPRRP